MFETIAGLRKNHPRLKRWSDYIADRLRGRDVLVRQGAAKGMVFNSGRSNAAYKLAVDAVEPDTERALAIALKPGMTFYDAGANFGWLSLVAAGLTGPAGNTVSFEPLIANADIIRHNVTANKFENAIVLPIALGDSDGHARFLRSSEPSWGMLEISGKKPEEFAGVMTVTIARLDTAVHAYQLPAPQLIKIDVEGAEVELLRGAEETIMSARPLLFIELHYTNAAVAQVLTQYGYRTALPGSSKAITDAPGYVHVFALPQEREDCSELLALVQSAAFPQCDRCRTI